MSSRCSASSRTASMWGRKSRRAATSSRSLLLPPALPAMQTPCCKALTRAVSNEDRVMTIVRTISAGRLLAVLGAVLLPVLLGSSASAAPLAIADVPVFLNATNAEPLVMLALSNDEQLYHKAYTDFDDIDGDGQIDATYKDTINYYGYFDPQKCYAYSGALDSGSFGPSGAAGGSNGHSCN